jgi:hypothetical protein
MGSQMIPHYPILHKVGTGGTGEVYLAEDIRILSGKDGCAQEPVSRRTLAIPRDFP